MSQNLKYVGIYDSHFEYIQNTVISLFLGWFWSNLHQNELSSLLQDILTAYVVFPFKLPVISSNYAVIRYNWWCFNRYPGNQIIGKQTHITVLRLINTYSFLKDTSFKPTLGKNKKQYLTCIWRLKVSKSYLSSVRVDNDRPGTSVFCEMWWYIVLRAWRPYGVSKLNSVRSAPVAALLSPFVRAPVMKWASSRENLSWGFVTWVGPNRPAQPQKLGRGLKFRI